MKVLLRKIAVSLYIALMGMTANAAEQRLNGMAVHSQLGKEQFIAAVYAETPTSTARDLLTAEQDKAMELRILEENLFPRRFQRMWIEGIAINAGAVEMEKSAQHLADFSNLLRPKLTTGDVLRIERLEHQKLTRVSLNGQVLGTIDDAHFFDLLLRTWIGPVPLSSEFKESLLAGGKVNPDLLARFNNTKPSSARTAELVALLRSPASSPATTLGPGIAEKVPPQTQPAVADAPAKPAAPPPPQELLTAETVFDDEIIFDERENEAYAFTAENLLSEQIYISKLAKWTSNFVKYPRSALRNQQEGTVRLTVTLLRDGRIRDVQVLEKSEHETLNKAATSAVKSASPYPAVPEEITGEQFLFTVPVVFKLN
jgi:periplasmic protein TonB